jgi:hypothetical protein
MPATTTTPAEVAPIRSPWLTVLISWFVPGAGHLYLGRRGRGLLIFATVLLAFVVGILLDGPFFDTSGAGDMLSRLIAYGGRAADIASGVLYFIAVWAGYAPPDRAGHDADYGSKFLVAAGLINILAMIDAYEIAKREKD